MNNDIAVTGLAGRFPGAGDIAQFWDLVIEGRDGTRRLDEDTLRAAGVPEADLRHPDYVPVWAGIEGVDQFASAFFGCSPREGDVLDPQQRLLLETAWHALEDAAVDPAKYDGDVGVFAGAGFSTYLVDNLLPDAGLVASVGRFVLATSNDKDNVAARLAYKLDLRGPSMTVQTNCSTGLVALHQATAALLDYQCDAAVVAVASVKSRGPQGYLHEAGGTSSPSGVCRAFDADADGYFLGDGVAAVVLRRAEDLEPGRDRVYAVVKSSALNNDGGAKVSYSATSRAAQVAVMRRALAAVDLDPAAVQYVEANGSATEMGDAIELAALAEVYGRETDRCLVGSLKPNVGNLDTLSGLGSFVKAVLALHHRQVPPSRNFASVNRHSHGVERLLEVNTRARAWAAPAGGPRRAAVSSFGVGGTNAHVVLEEAPAVPRPESDGRSALLALSARTAEELRVSAERLAAHLRTHPDLSLTDVAHTLLVGRRDFPHRASVVAACVDGAVDALGRLSPVLAEDTVDWGLLLDPEVDPAAVEVLRKAWPVYDEHYSRVMALHPASGSLPSTSALHVFAAQLALVESLRGWGLAPSAVTGAGTARAVARAMADPDLVPAIVAGLGVEGADGPGTTPSPDPTTPAPPGWVEPDPLWTGLLDEAPSAVVRVGRPARPAPEEVGVPVVALLDGHASDAASAVLAAAGRLWCLGARLRGDAVHQGHDAARVSLPGYPFTRTRHWVERQPTAVPATAGQAAAAAVAPAAAAASATPVQEAVASIWRRRLGLAAVGLDDSLLDLGGDSLRAAQILADVTEAFQVQLSLRECLERPTVRAMAETIHGRFVEARELREALDVLAARDGSGT